MEEVLANIDHLEGLVDTQLRQLGPQVETIRALRNAEETRREGLQLLLEQRRLAHDAVDQSDQFLPASIRLSRQGLEAHRRAFRSPAMEKALEVGSPTTQTSSPMPCYDAAAAALDAYSPTEGPLAQVEQAVRIVEAVLTALQQNLGSAEARHIDQMLDLRRQLDVGRSLYQQELHTLKQVIAQQEKRTQTHTEYLEAAKVRLEEAVQERRVAAMKPQYRAATEESEDGTLLSPQFSDDDRTSDTSSTVSGVRLSSRTTRSSSAQPPRSTSAPQTAAPKGSKSNALRSTQSKP